MRSMWRLDNQRMVAPWRSGKSSQLQKPENFGRKSRVDLEEKDHNSLDQPIILGGGNSIIFHFHPYLGKWSNLTNIFERGWNHQLVIRLYQPIIVLRIPLAKIAKVYGPVNSVTVTFLGWWVFYVTFSKVWSHWITSYLFFLILFRFHIFCCVAGCTFVVYEFHPSMEQVKHIYCNIAYISLNIHMFFV